MATTINKQKLVNQLFALQHKGAKGTAPQGRQVLEQFLYAICREGVTRDAADQAYASLREQFFDWNELRVSSPAEIAGAIDDYVPDGEARGQRLVDFLQEVFETNFSFDLEGLQKKGLKQAAKQLSRYQAANEYAVSWVVQKSLGGHALPLDTAALRVLRRLGVFEEGNDLEALRTSLEHQIAKPKGAEFVDVLSTLADEHCFETNPNCHSCPLHKTCPTGMSKKAAAASKRSR